MLDSDFDFTGRLVSVRFNKPNASSHDFTSNGKYFVRISKDYKSRKTGQYETLYHEFVMWNDDNRKSVKSLVTYVGIGDVVEVAGDFTPERKAPNGTWYRSEDNIKHFKRIARSFKHQQQSHQRFVQNGGQQQRGTQYGYQSMPNYDRTDSQPKSALRPYSNNQYRNTMTTNPMHQGSANTRLNNGDRPLNHDSHQQHRVSNTANQSNKSSNEHDPFTSHKKLNIDGKDLPF